MMFGTRLDSRILRFAATLILISLGLSACNRDVPQVRKAEVSINLRALGINRSETFRDVRANALPRAVLEQMGRVADAGEPFYATDVILLPESQRFLLRPTRNITANLPMIQLIVAAVSEHYCALTYLQGGYVLSFNTRVFELSDGNARLIGSMEDPTQAFWHSQKKEGVVYMTLDLEDLKREIESGRMWNEEPQPVQRVEG